MQHFIASAPFRMTTETLGVIRNSLRSTSSSTPSPLLSQIDAYCKARFIPRYTISPEVEKLIEALISLWHQNSDRNHHDLALLIGDLPYTSCKFRCGCLRDVTTLSESWIFSPLQALDFHDGNLDLGCIALIRLLASEKRTDILRRWRKVLSFVIKKQHEKLLLHAVTHLTTDMWFELLSNIRVVYDGSEVMTERHFSDS